MTVGSFEHLVKRGGDGQLLPVPVDIELGGETATYSFLPLTLGDINDISSDVDISDTQAMSKQSKLMINLLKRHLVQPVLSDDQWNALSLSTVIELFRQGLLSASGAEGQKKTIPT